ncbi:hypothetical protein G5C51_33730 [Streptomyces sp. A7024]|uniref:Uncharacterized protein n=1 Tax=Streptomyces coryli TaxID=1128680 RepID=A0A6G4UCB7_9ACTN|nr:hypothetical protein [Streptomyces coryli]
MLAEGPPVVTVAELEDARYGVSDLLDDLAGCAAREAGGERLFIVGELSRCTAELALLAAGAWAGGGGKQLARRLEEAVPGLAARLQAAGALALEGKSDALSAVAQEVLDGSGGRLWAGYRRQGYLPGMPEASTDR